MSPLVFVFFECPINVPLPDAFFDGPFGLYGPFRNPMLFSNSFDDDPFGPFVAPLFKL